jgi:hypothetical protein
VREPQRRSREQEKRGARTFGAALNAASGSLDLRKNDARNKEESIEFKSTAAASYRLRHDDLVTAYVNAIQDARRMVFGIEFAGDRSFGLSRFTVLTEDDYLELTGRGDSHRS